MPNHIHPLLEARWGRPTEAKAAETIAIFSVIPAAILGIGVGVGIVPVGASFGRLLGVCSFAALACSAASLFSLKALHRWVGFRAVVKCADAMIGGWIGLFVGGFIMVFAELDVWPLLLAPLGALGNLLLPRSAPPQTDETPSARTAITVESPASPTDRAGTPPPPSRG